MMENSNQNLGPFAFQRKVEEAKRHSMRLVEHNPSMEPWDRKASKSSEGRKSVEVEASSTELNSMSKAKRTQESMAYEVENFDNSASFDPVTQLCRPHHLKLQSMIRSNAQPHFFHLYKKREYLTPQAYETRFVWYCTLFHLHWFKTDSIDS